MMYLTSAVDPAAAASPMQSYHYKGARSTHMNFSLGFLISTHQPPVNLRHRLRIRKIKGRKFNPELEKAKKHPCNTDLRKHVLIYAWRHLPTVPQPIDAGRCLGQALALQQISENTKAVHTLSFTLVHALLVALLVLLEADAGARSTCDVYWRWLWLCLSTRKSVVDIDRTFQISARDDVKECTHCYLLSTHVTYCCVSKLLHIQN